uniref:Uncharacterized protein n=1 Tax=Siphoviridae sp. ctm7X10 TaxID=2827929 RepID=A0A8S5S5X8_9CAUD|nr:MAG TPA: hypothetical protein [Siphoviridae sp. ctm7X10]
MRFLAVVFLGQFFELQTLSSEMEVIPHYILFYTNLFLRAFSIKLNLCFNKHKFVCCFFDSCRLISYVNQ